MQQVFEFVKNNMTIMVLYSSIISLLLFMVVWIQSSKIKKMRTKINGLSSNREGKNIEEIIAEYYSKIDDLELRMNQMNVLTDTIQKKLLHSIQRVGMVQYNAFDDMGGTLSFSMAMLDEENNGFILTNIYGRNSNMLYLKPIRKGKSSHTLSAEEYQALDRAKHQSFDEYQKIAL